MVTSAYGVPAHSEALWGKVHSGYAERKSIMEFKPRFLATGIGSMPFDDPDHAVEVSLERLHEAPFWPQLPRLGYREQMIPQYAEGMPRLIVDPEEGRLHFDTSGDYAMELAEFYEAYLMATDPDAGTGDFSPLAIGPEFSKGIPAFERGLQQRESKLPFVKVQATGPCTFALGVMDENKSFIFYNPEFRDVVAKALAMKCRWQIRKFQPYAEKVICFLDEPVLSAYGSSTYVTVKRDEVVGLLAEMVEAIHADGAVAGVHCCGNTEWSILIDAGADLINFDAFEYGETIAIYSDDVKVHIERGGVLAWGVVPTSEAIRDQTVEGLAEHFERMMDNLADKGIDKQQIVEQALITPSCGTGSMECADAEKVFETTAALSCAMREKYGFASY